MVVELSTMGYEDRLKAMDFTTLGDII